MTSVAPHGSWPSIVTAEDVVRAGSQPTAVHACRGTVWWSETRPAESGREAIVRRDPDGSRHEVLPAGFDARTAVHEYGGGAWWVHGDTVFAASWTDQRLHRVDGLGQPRPITPIPPAPRSWRYADGSLTPDGRWVVCVRERHEGPSAADVHNELVALPADGSSEPTVLVSGPDFVAAPRISPDGTTLAWISWDHPNMPWDVTQLWRGGLREAGDRLVLEPPEHVAGTGDESLVQPEWGPDGELFVCSDRSDWWNVHRVLGDGSLVPVAPVRAEVGAAAWTFGQSRYVVAPDGTVVTAHDDGLDTVLSSAPPDGDPTSLRLEHQSVRSLRHDGERLIGVVSFPNQPPQVRDLVSGTVLREASEPALPAEWISIPTRESFAAAEGHLAHAWVYLPRNPGVQGAPGSLPPLLVRVHGGPTASAHPGYSIAIQFWTSRGFAVADVDHRGSTGYGRAYRALLRGQWGVIDVEDATSAASHLASSGTVDAARLAIRGGSAGGMTTLLASMLGDTFAAAVTSFGVVDLRALTHQTHKFESRYLDSLVGPLPEAIEVYRERSPISHVDRAHTPTLVMQGLEDPVVPPAQALAIVQALADHRVTHAYIGFPGEQHGFRQPASQVRALQAELAFYAAVFGFDPADELPALDLRFAENLPHPTG